MDEVLLPLLGIELKSVHSVWTAKDVLFGEKPKLGHIAQAAHYMWQLGVPYRMVYKSYSQLGQGAADWMSKLFPAPGQPGSEWIEYGAKGKMKHVKQFEIVYEMEFDPHGRVVYRLEGSTEWKHSVVTRDDIARYYDFVSRMGDGPAGVGLGPRPSTLDVSGGKAGFSECDYCPLQDTCDSTEGQGYGRWLEAVKKVTSGDD